MFCVIGFLAYMYYPENHFALQYQAAIDCKRIQAVHEIADWAERFHAKQGHYPLANHYPLPDGKQSITAISVIITDKTLPKSYAVNPPREIEGMLIPPGRFEKEIEQALGIDIKLPYDPQTNFAWEKRFYLYKALSDGHYSVSGILFSATEHTQKQANHRHQYQVGSTPSQVNRTRQYKTIQNKSVVCEAP